MTMAASHVHGVETSDIRKWDSRIALNIAPFMMGNWKVDKESECGWFELQLVYD